MSAVAPLRRGTGAESHIPPVAPPTTRCTGRPRSALGARTGRPCRDADVCGRAGFGRRSRARPARRGGQHLDLADGEGRGPGAADAAAARRLALPGFLRRFLQEQGRHRTATARSSRSAPASSSTPTGLRRHQQPRDRRRRRHRGELSERHEARRRSWSAPTPRPTLRC